MYYVVRPLYHWYSNVFSYKGADGSQGHLTIGSVGPSGSDVGLEDAIDGSGGNIIDPQRTKALKANLQMKIQKTMELIKDEQNTKEGKYHKCEYKYQ